jgi:hypothetical protein
MAAMLGPQSHEMPMSRKNKKLASLILLLLFLSVSLFIDLFHTENTALKDSSCPACHFQQSSIAIPQTVSLELPDLVLVGILDLPLSGEYEAFPARAVAARSPPQM